MPHAGFEGALRPKALLPCRAMLLNIEPLRLKTRRGPQVEMHGVLEKHIMRNSCHSSRCATSERGLSPEDPVSIQYLLRIQDVQPLCR